MSDARPSPTFTAEQRDELRRLLASEQARRKAQRQQLPVWLPVAMRALPYVLLSVTILNLLIALVAILTPYLEMWLGPAVTDPIYVFYSFICPQRPSHTFHIDGHAMAFEHRDISVHAGLGLAGILYLFWDRLRKPLPTWAALAMIAPMLIDVAISSAGILPSTWFSRLWTGGLAGVAVIWWSYPRFDSYLRKVQVHVARLQAVRAE